MTGRLRPKRISGTDRHHCKTCKNTCGSRLCADHVVSICSTGFVAPERRTVFDVCRPRQSSKYFSYGLIWVISGLIEYPRFADSLLDIGSERTVSDSRTISRVRLTTAERGGGDKPLAKPIAAGLIVQPVPSVRPGLAAEQFLDFPSTLALDDLISGLRIAGFEGFEDNDQEIDQPLAIPETPAPAPMTLSIQRPILEVKPATATAVVYEPMEFLDYEDEEDTYAETETEPVEIFAPPAVLTAFLTVPEPCGAAPSAAKLQSGFGSASFIDAPVEIPVLALQTIRRKLRYGPNPSPSPQAPVQSLNRLLLLQSLRLFHRGFLRQLPNVLLQPLQPAAPTIKAERPAAKTMPPAATRGNAVPIEEVVRRRGPAA